MYQDKKLFNFLRTSKLFTERGTIVVIHLRKSFLVSASLVREYYNSPTKLVPRLCFACPGILQFTYETRSSSLLRLSGNTTKSIIQHKNHIKIRESNLIYTLDIIYFIISLFTIYQQKYKINGRTFT
jgi:hypothetical protein